MRLWSLTFLLFVSHSWAYEIGRVTKITGAHDAFLLRKGEKMALTVESSLSLGDELYSNSGHIILHLYPATQISLLKDSSVKLTEHKIEESKDSEKAFSVIKFVSGIIRLQVIRSADQEIEQKVEADGVSFGVRGTEFEVSLGESKKVNLDVFEGEVLVSSPFVHTFVPEIVKAQEGFSFDKKQRSFARRKFAPKFAKAIEFDDSRKLRKLWHQQRKLKRKKSLKRILKSKNRKGPRT